MNQSELIEKVARATELNQTAAGQAVKAVVTAILDSLVAGEAVRVSGLGSFNVAERPARRGRNPQSGETIEIAARKAVRFQPGKAVRTPSTGRSGLLARSPPRQRNPRCGSKTSPTSPISRPPAVRAGHMVFTGRSGQHSLATSLKCGVLTCPEGDHSFRERDRGFN